MADKQDIKFTISHIKKAIWELSCINRLKPNTIDSKIIEELKLTLMMYQIKYKTDGD